MGNLLTLLDWSQNSINEQVDQLLIMNNIFYLFVFLLGRAEFNQSLSKWAIFLV